MEVIYQFAISISNEMSSNNHIQHNEHRGFVYKYIQIQTRGDLNLGGIPGNYWWGVCRPVLQVNTLFQTKKCKYSYPFSYLTSKKLCHHYFD